MCRSLWKLHTNKFYSQRTIDFYTIGHRSIKEENSSKSAFQKNSTKQGTWNTKPFEISMTYVFFAKNFLDSKKNVSRNEHLQDIWKNKHRAWNSF